MGALVHCQTWGGHRHGNSADNGIKPTAIPLENNIPRACGGVVDWTGASGLYKIESANVMDRDITVIRDTSKSVKKLILPVYILLFFPSEGISKNFCF
jgi:hypothetical protein